MRQFSGKRMAAFLLLISVVGCSKPEEKLIGKWVNQKTSNSIEFNSDKTGVIFQRTSPNLPPNIQFKWAMADDKTFKVTVGAQGSANGPAALGTLQGDDTMVLEKDTFKKVK